MAVDSAHKELEDLLKALREEPVNSDGTQDRYLTPTWSYLMKIRPSDSDNVLHWFCSKATPLTVETATFLLRLFAYNSARVVEWKKRMSQCLTSCPNCVQGLQERKLSSRRTYFGAFTEPVVQVFWRSFEDWERGLILTSLNPAGPLTEPSSELASPATIYRIVCDPRMLKEPKIHVALCAVASSSRKPQLPMEPPPVGLFYLCVDENPDARTWARAQLKLTKRLPMLSSDYNCRYTDAMEELVKPLNQEVLVAPSFPFSGDATVLWSGLLEILRFVPDEFLRSSHACGVDFRHIVVGHLHDPGPQFEPVLRCLIYLLHRMGGRFWDGEDTTYPQVVFDSVKDNAAFLRLVQDASSAAWSIRWFNEYIQTFWDSPVWGEVLVKTVGLLCDEAQHERFKEARPVVMCAGANLLLEVMRKARNQATSNLKSDTSTADLTGDQRPIKSSKIDPLVSAIDIHAEIFVAVAFGRAYSDMEWQEARSSTRVLLRIVLHNDVLAVNTGITNLCRLMHRAGIQMTMPIVRTHLWKMVYTGVGANDADAVGFLITIASKFAHLDRLTPNAFRDAVTKGPDSAIKTLEGVNRAVEVFRDGFSQAIFKFADSNPAHTVVALLRRPACVKELIALLMSPVEDIQIAAQALVSQAYDVDGRLDCFRALLENLPHETLEGIFVYLGTFIDFVPSLPEACNLSRSVVRCLTDVIEVLCSSTNGLLLRDLFNKGRNGDPGPAADLPRLWAFMAKTISIIFKRTPSWSQYFEIEEMVVWMRDALIFGIEMVDQRRVVETAVVANSAQPSGESKKLTRVGKQLVKDLQQVFLELIRWLRLTDFELLHQSFVLLEKLFNCFRETGIQPDETGLAKIRKHVEDGRKKDKERLQTRLDDARLAKLEEYLAWFDDDDEVEIVPAPLPKMPTTRVAGPSRPKTTLPLAKGDTKQSRSVSLVTTTAPKVLSKAPGPRVPPSTAAKPVQARSLSSAATKSALSLKPKTGTKSDGGSETPGGLVSSSDDESETDDGRPAKRGLAALANLQTTPKIKKVAERRQVKLIDDSAVGLKVQARFKARDEAKRTALRLKPDISPLHKIVLSWDYRNLDEEAPAVSSLRPAVRVPDTFPSYDQYRQTFEPLLVMECWAQLRQSKEDSREEDYHCKISSRQFIDDWIELDIVIPDTVRKDWSLAETDVVLLQRRHVQGQSEDSTKRTCILAKVQVYKASPRGIQGTLRVHLADSTNDPGLQIGTDWLLRKVLSLSTLHREYGALIGLQAYDFLPQILQPRLPKRSDVEPAEVRRAMSTYKVNEPQALAILSALRTDDFSLIQGPPGTGKTTTICGLVKAFISSRARPVTMIQPGRSNAFPEKPVLPKVLICAPSNAAIDEVAKRLKESIDGSVVRVGAEKTINISVKDISLDALVDLKLSATRSSGTALQDVGNQINTLRAELDTVKQLRQQKEDEASSITDNVEKRRAVGEEIHALKQRRVNITQRLDKLRDKQRDDRRTLDGIRRKYRMEVLQDADVICSTLSGAGHDILEQFDGFDMVIIDEAAQAIELSTLIPLKYKCKRCIMVGDPQQLPPTVLSQQARRYLYDQSLFVRLQRQRPDAIHLLSIQYRMHPEISQLPRQVFYSGQLRDGPCMAEKTQQPWHQHEKFGSYRFFNIARGQEQAASSGSSLVNPVECQVAVALYHRLLKDFPKIDFDFRVGVVSMYRAQIQALKRKFEERFGSEILAKVDFNTVDGFQGQEKDIIILSCVRATPGSKGVGFLADTRRMNVALTRARSSLFILGHISTLERSDTTWRDIVVNARSRSHLTEADVAYFTSPVSSTASAPPARILAKDKPAARRVAPDAVPTDLLAPKDFGLKASAPSIKEPPLSTPLNGDFQHLSLQPEPNEPSAASSMPTVTHPASAFRTLPISASTPVAGKPKIQMKKKPKPEVNMFLPKKPNKRPAPDASGGGPSNIKRRLQ